MFRYGKFVLVFLCAVFFCACGLDTFYVMESRPYREHDIDYTSSDPAEMYFNFTTASNTNAGDFRFLGTAVYYKIYANPSTMQSNISSIESVNDSKNYSAAAERMIGTYKFQSLCTETGEELIIENPLYDTVIRLTNNDENNAIAESWWTNAAGIKIRPDKNSAPVLSFLPRRIKGSGYTFDFGRYGKSGYEGNGLRYDAPSSDDEDFDGAAVSENKYYVCLYAVAVGQDTLFKRYYSNVTYLGTVVIDADSENN